MNDFNKEFKKAVNIVALNNHALPRMLIFDTETTGFRPGNICQLSYLIVDDGKVTPGNYYFKVGYVEPGAQRIHGLSVEKLKRLSNGKSFVDYHHEFIDDFTNADLLVAHNFNFDNTFLKSEFSRCGISNFYPDSLCTMNYFTNICKIPSDSGYGYKWPRLEELIAYFKIKEKTINDATRDYFASKDLGYHDARFDTTATYLCLIKALDMGLIKFGLAST